MPRFSDHLVKSAIKLERTSTTVPNPSNTSAFTAETSDMFAPLLLVWPASCISKHLAVLNETEIVSDPIVKNTRLRVARLGQPIDAARIRRLGPLVNCLDQRPSQSLAPRSFCDKQIFQIAISVGSPG